MKVLHMLQSNRFSGAENVVCQIISMCKDSGVEFAYASRDGQIRDALKERSIEFYPVKKVSVSEFRRVIKEVKPDVIHAHDMCASLYASLACGSIPLISHVHNNNFNSRGLSIKSVLYYIAAKKARHIFWVSQSSFDGYALHKSLVKKSSVLYNTIDIDALEKKATLDKTEYNYDIAYIGRLTYPKNPHRLIDIFERILKQRLETKIAVVGTGDLEEDIKQKAVNKGLTKNVDFLGFHSNPLKILQNAKLMIMTSRWEGTPMCALEAMALGVPIVSTPTDGLCELVDDGKTGYLSENDEELAKACLNILNNEELHKALSENSYKRARLMMNTEKYKNEIMKAYEL